MLWDYVQEALSTKGIVDIVVIGWNLFRLESGEWLYEDFTTVESPGHLCSNPAKKILWKDCSIAKL